MSVVDFECRVEERSVNGHSKVVAEREFPQHSVMKIGTVRSWVRRAYNKALRQAGQDIIVEASYRGNMKRSPFFHYGGSLSGVNGRTMREDGEFVR